MTKKKVSNIIKENTRIILPPSKSIKNPATILYKRLPADMILIVGFENFLTMDNILDKHRRVVAMTYQNYPMRMFSDVGGVLLYGNNGMSSLRVGEVLSKDEFSKTIAHIKKCGSLLHDIIIAVNDGEVNRIKI